MKKYMPIVATVTVSGIVFGAGGYVIGSTHPQTQNNNSTSQSQNQRGMMGMGQGGRGSMQRPNSGTVKTVSDTSITVTMNNQDQSYVISSNTIVSNQNTTATIADIKSGDTVLVIANGTTAERIIKNSSMQNQGPDNGDMGTQLN